MTKARNREAWALANTKVEVANMKKSLQAEIKELKEITNTQIN